MSPLVVPFKKKMGIKRAERREGARADLSGAKRAPDSGVTIIFAPPGKHSLRANSLDTSFG